MKVALCSSAKFFDKLPEIKKELEKLGFSVILPSMENKKYLKETKGEEHFAKVHSEFMRDSFEKIEKSDAILVMNYDKDNVKHHIGGNVLIEMGKAFDEGIPIFLWNPPPKELRYREEILAMQPIVINQDLSKMKEEIE